MHDLNKYVSGLLFIHDCVILPGFGGFVTNYHQAEHHSESNTFIPPKKDVLFNKHLTYNDGLLINYLSKNQKISYEEAEEKIKTEVQKAWLKLDKGEEVIFDGIGTFKIDKEERLAFKPADTENYLTDSYGLSSFRFPPLSYQKNSIDLIPKYNDSRAMNDGLKQTLKWVAIAVPIVGILALIPYYNNYKQQSAGVDFVSLPTEKAIEETYTAMPSDSNITGVIDQTTDKRTALFYTEIPKEEAVKKQAVPGQTFYLIGGSYKDEANANIHCEEFITDGFTAEVIHVDDYYRVSLANYDSKVNALHELRRVKSEESYSKVWLFSN